MSFPERLEFICPVKILCGQRALEHIPYELNARNARRPLVLSDEAAFRENRIRALTDALRESDMHLGAVEGLPASGDRECLLELAAIYRDRDHDALVAVGSGSLVDMAKRLNFVVSTGQVEPQHFSAERLEIDVPVKPLVLIAPAAATGYEASGRVQTEGVDPRSELLMPDLVCIDERTLGSPGRDNLIATGIIALALGAEAVLSADGNPMRDIYAANAVKMAVAALRATDQMPDATAPRMHLATAAVLTGCSLGARPPGELEQIAGHLSDTGRVSLAEALGILLPAAVEHGARNWGWSPTDLLPLLAGPERAASTPSGQRSIRTTATLTELFNDLFSFTAGRIPRTLRDAGFAREELASIGASLSATGAGIAHEKVTALLMAALDGAPADPGY